MIKDMTKRMYATVLEEMLERSPLDDISVTELCERSGTPRQTFYYHFRDKYDLVAWIYMEDYSVPVEGELSDGNFTKRTATILERMWRRRDFYRRAFKSESQNSLRRYIFERNYENGKGIILRSSGRDSITEAESFLLKFNSYGGTSTTIDWILGTLNLSIDEYAELLCKRIYGLQSSLIG